MKKSITLIVALIFVFNLSNSVAQVKWLTMKQAQELQKKEPRKIFIDVYTDWCGWCKVMDSKTFSQPSIAKYLNENFYPVKFNAEHKDTVRFKDMDFTNPNPNGRRSPHKFAAVLLDGRMGYPSIVFLDENLDRIFPKSGYHAPEAMEPLLHYVIENEYKDKTLQEYKTTFNGEFYKSGK